MESDHGIRLGDKRRNRSLSLLAIVLLSHLWDVVLKVKGLDHLLENWVLSDLDILDLDLGAVWDEVHLALSFLL